MLRPRNRLGVVFILLGLLAAGAEPALADKPGPGPAKGPDRVFQAQRTTQPGAAEPDGLQAWPVHRAPFPAGGRPLNAQTSQVKPLMGVLVSGNQQGLTASSASPSDSTGAIGPNHYIEMVNTQVGLFDRSLGAPSATAPLATFIGAAAGFRTTDPQVQWDQQGARWLYAALELNTSVTPNTFKVGFGWSKQGDPNALTLNNTDWCNFHIDTSTDTYDYPKLGHDANYIEIGANVYPNGGSTFGRGALLAVAKPAPGDTSCTAPAAARDFSLGGVQTPVPSNTTDASSIGYMVAMSPTAISVWHVSPNPVGTCTPGPCLISDGNIGITPWAAQAADFTVPQPGGAAPLDALDGRLTQAVQHSDPMAGGAEAVWTQHTTSTTSGRTAVTWYELIPSACVAGVCSAAAKRQEGMLSSPTLHLFNAAISPTSRGDAAVIHYNTGSATTFVDVRAQRRDGADPLNAMSGELTLRESSVADTDFTCSAPNGPTCRWGDYAGASPDPSDCSLVWGTTMLSGSVASTGTPTWVTQNFALGEGRVQSTASTKQYVLTGSDGNTWVEMDATNLRLGSTRCADSTAVITANTDLFTSKAGVNQDIGIFVDRDGVAAPVPLAWKESGGSNGTFSPNAAYVQASYPIAAGHSYVVRLKWKTNAATSGSIYAGAGPLPTGENSPTRLTVQYYATAPQLSQTNSQPRLAGSNGSTWSPIPGVAPLTITTAGPMRVLFGGNADLWTDTAGINQDIGITLNGNLIAWKESGGSGTYSPDAAFVQVTADLAGAGTYTAQLVWKTNQPSPPSASIYAGAGPLPGPSFSPTSLLAAVLPAGGTPFETLTTNQLNLPNSDGATWGAMNIQFAITPSTSMYAVVGANADLWTAKAGYNQDLAVFVSDNGSMQRLVWKESGGVGGTFSPNAAFAEAVMSLTAGHTYIFSLMWKTNQPAPGATIFTGAGPIGGAYSPTRLLVNTF